MKLSTFDARLFVMVADLGGFSAAARQLDLQKSWVSRELAQLEERLGVRLLHRTTRQVSLTEAGAQLLPHARRVVAALEAAESEMESLGGHARGQLRVTVPYAFARFVLAGALPEFLRAYPDIRIHIDTSSQVADLVHDSYDLAVRIGELPSSSLVVRPIARVPLLLVCSPDYAARQALPATPDDLLQHPLVGLGNSFEHPPWPLHGARGEVQTLPVEPRAVVPDPGLAIDMARSGAGIAVAPQLYAGPWLAQGQLHHVLPGWTLGERPVQFVLPSRKLTTPKARAFMDFVGDRVASHLGPAATLSADAAR